MCDDIRLERATVEKEKSKVVAVIDVQIGGPLVLPDGLDLSRHESLIDFDRLERHVVLLVAATTIFVGLAFIRSFVFVFRLCSLFLGASRISRCRFFPGLTTLVLGSCFAFLTFVSQCETVLLEVKDDAIYLFIEDGNVLIEPCKGPLHVLRAFS